MFRPQRLTNKAGSFTKFWLILRLIHERPAGTAARQLSPTVGVLRQDRGTQIDFPLESTENSRESLGAVQLEPFN